MLVCVEISILSKYYSDLSLSQIVAVDFFSRARKQSEMLKYKGEYQHVGVLQTVVSL